MSMDESCIALDEVLHVEETVAFFAPTRAAARAVMERVRALPPGEQVAEVAELMRDVLTASHDAAGNDLTTSMAWQALDDLVAALDGCLVCLEEVGKPCRAKN